MPGLAHPPLIDLGSILTVGVVSKADRVALVMPFITDDTGLSFSTLNQDLVAAFIAGPLATLIAVMAADSYVAFLQAEGMIDGTIPERVDFAPADHPGGYGSDAMPNNVSGLTVFYGDPLDIPDGDRTPVGKSFWPAVPKDEVTGDLISGTLHASYQTLAGALRTGFATALGGGKWFRVAGKGASRQPGTEGVGCVSTRTRNYVATQRRRLTPH